MNKWIINLLISVLVIVVIVAGVVYYQKIGELKDAQTEIASLEEVVYTLEAKVSNIETDLAATEAQVSTLEPSLAAAEAQVSTLQADLSATEAQVSILETGLAAAEAQVSTLQADLAAESDELAEIKKVYPVRNFSSRRELEEWLIANDISEKPNTPDVERWLSRALEVQKDAFADGYVVSVDYDGPDEEGGYTVFCTTVIDGYIWWWDPETDDIAQQQGLARIE